MHPMQYFINRSKHFILAVLSCSLFIALNAGNPEISGLGFITTQIHKQTAKTDDSFWSSMSSDLKLDHKTQSARVQAEIRKLLADQGKLYQILQQAAPYIYFIHKQTEARGLPGELALIPVIESEFNPNDHSKKGATGLWQLMPETAHELGINIKSGYDGRRNVVASTKAALAYFNDLGNCFNGNWYLAIAAYNCGQVKVQKEQRRTGSESFWNLPLPKETKYYVPKLLAVAAIVKNPAKYGVHLPPISNEPYFTEIKLKKAVKLAQVSETAGISLETLHTLNPDYNHGNVLPKKGAYTLLVPTDKVVAVREELADKVLTV